MCDSTTAIPPTQFLPGKPNWLGAANDQNSWEKYSCVSTCLALSRAVYATNAQNCIRTLNDLKDMRHGITELIYSQNCEHQYLIALKKCTKEIYVAFRGTDGWSTIYSDIRCFLTPNEFQGRFHNGFYRRSKLIPLASFIDLLNRYEDFKLILTGHSLGGAIAATLTVRLLFDEKSTNLKPRIQCIAFGAPLICDDDCSKYINECYPTHFHFYVNQNDVVPIILSSVSEFVSDKLSRTKLWIKTSFDNLIDDVQKEETKEFGPPVSDDVQSFVKNDASGSETSRGFINSCLDAISLRYAPFGLIFHTGPNLSSEDSSSEYIVPFTELDFKKYSNSLYDSQRRTINWSSPLIRYQNHSIKNYIIEIYDRVIHSQRLTSNYDSWTEVELIKEFTSISPLKIFFLPEKDLWTAFNREKPKSDYNWSVERTIREQENEETITLQLQGPAVNFITKVKCEQSIYAQNPAKPDESLSQTSLKVFVMTLPLRRNPTTDQYPFHIITHFEVVNLKGLFNPKFFVSRTGLEGRKRQISEFILIELYKLAFSYSTLTGPTTVEHANEPIDAQRRCRVTEYLLLCEKLCQEEFKTIESSLKSRKNEIFNKVKEEISYIHQERIQRQFELSKSNNITTTTTYIEQISSGSPPLKLIKLQTIMNEWQNHTSNTDEPDLDTIKIIEKVIPTLVAIIFSLITAKYDSVLEDRLFAGSLAGSTGGFLLSVFLTINETYGYPIAVLAALLGGVGAYIYDIMQEAQKKYANILMRLAQSLGLVMEQIVEHPYSLEKEISSIYIEKFKAFDDNVYHILENWSYFFPNKPFRSLPVMKYRMFCIRLIKCVDAHFQMRQLLSQEFAVGVVGPGRTGKSKLIQQMFNFNTKAGQERTVDMHSYRVSDQFRIVDFPHSTSTKDPLRSSYLCHHTLVNAVIVVLDARKLGDESSEKCIIEMVKSLAKDGVDVLYCFNITDELIKDRKGDKIESRRRNPFETTENTSDHELKSEHSVTQQFRTSWTKEKLIETLATFSKNYEIDIDNCLLTFFELDVPKDQWNGTCTILNNLGIKNPDYIKKVWLRKVLGSNSIPPESIEKVMKFWNE